MSLHTPDNPSLILKGLDLKIETIKGSLSDLTWLSKSFGLADRIVDMKDDKPYIFPVVFESNMKDPIPMTPSDDYNAFSFWVRSGDAELQSETNLTNPLVTYPVSCIFYIDIKKLDNVSTYKETKSKLTEDIFHFFNTVQPGCLLVAKKFIEDDITKVYDGFTLEQMDNKFKMYPKWACRMDFDISFRDACYSDNTYFHT
jgi:hypothetical protein